MNSDLYIKPFQSRATKERIYKIIQLGIALLVLAFVVPVCYIYFNDYSVIKFINSTFFNVWMALSAIAIIFIVFFDREYNSTYATSEQINAVLPNLTSEKVRNTILKIVEANKEVSDWELLAINSKLKVHLRKLTAASGSSDNDEIRKTKSDLSALEHLTKQLTAN